MEVSYTDLQGKKTLIMGDLGSGKTEYAKRLLDEAIEEAEELITVIDFAPALRTKDGAEVGGRLYDGGSHMVKVLSSKLMKTPRITAKTPEELIKLADYNRNITEALLDQFNGSASSIVFVNDVHLHLHRGTLQTLWDAVREVDTVVLTGYMGSKLNSDLDTGVSRRERLLMVRLGSKVDRVIQL
ncbi:hypothetical protein JXL21_00175 [Candidatus Bathyarchaeota archaeon]|nr:hypothetical protein [Candidatus Bathyarchaeota archaeon]